MSVNDSSKEFWIVPKRANLHQSICFIEAVINRGYDNTVWNATKQNNIGNELRKRGATQFGRTPSPQAMRTHLSLVQYLGFLYIDNTTTPSTLKVTKAGRKFLEFHEDDIETVDNLVVGKKQRKLILTSPVFKTQFEKLQLTNPIELKHCKNILVFPFRATLRLIKELGYLDQEEIGYFLFNIKREDEIPLVKLQIERFREQSKDKRIKEIETFKKTSYGNIALVQAPTANYFMSLCENTGIIKKCSIEIPNPGAKPFKKLPAIRIKEGFEEYVTEILERKYYGVEPYDYGDDIQLWMEYYGEPDRLSPPIDVTLENDGDDDLLLIIEKNESMVTGDLIKPNNYIVCPMFIDEKYIVKLMNPKSGEMIAEHSIIPNNTNKTFVFNTTIGRKSTPNKITDLRTKILNHSKARTFEKGFLSYLKVLEKITGEDHSNNKNLRGGYYEFLFFQLLEELVMNGVIDDVYWNGKIGQYGLPRPAPGGRTGTPDIVFKINDEYFVLEVTVIKPKSTQFSVEGSSVPDHIKLFKQENPTKKVNGIFVAPLIHERNTSAMQAVLDKVNIKLKCITDTDFVDILMRLNKEEIIEELKY